MRTAMVRLFVVAVLPILIAYCIVSRLGEAMRSVMVLIVSDICDELEAAAQAWRTGRLD